MTVWVYPLAMVRAAAQFVLAFAGFILLVVSVLCVLLTGPLLGIPAILTRRWWPDLTRRFASWSGVRIDRPYRQLRESAGFRALWKWLISDPATYRDSAWMLLEPLVGGVILLPAVLTPVALAGAVIPVSGWWFGIAGWGLRVLLVAACFVVAAVGIATAPALLRVHAKWTKVLLSPTRTTVRLHQLEETRSEALESEAREVRRIERDLHDGAQARLIGVGMTIGAAERAFDRDPDRAKELLLKARESTALAVRELRDLVHGILPPVLSERGLGDAVRALVLEQRLARETQIDLPGRVAAAVESAAYFAIAELLTNVTKHAGATKVWVDLAFARERLRIVVLDDGCGGADVAAGSGLRGIERRLAAFDGSFTLTSPPGGPTMVTMEIPCALSSPRTCTSSEKA
ncbi:sensor histidine kinase [Amycolatopsis minnesotensis]|uniref:histidine kinase n=1 Tax=Amycolatopsis minnesotensis TaxID=337894 RepID=A0ABN2Q4J2_9PSEU